MTTEQLAALKEVAERSQLGTDHPAAALRVYVNEFIAAFDPTTCLELLKEVERLREHLANVEHDFKSTLKHCDDHHIEGHDE